MFPAAPADQLFRFRNNVDPRESGIWSVLVTKSPIHSAEFGERYFDFFNDAAGRYWHMGILATWVGYDTWSENSALHSAGERIRRVLWRSKKRVPDNFILFFDPAATKFREEGFIPEVFEDGAFSETCLIVELKAGDIVNGSRMRSKISDISRAIVEAIDAEGVDPSQTANSGRVPYVISRLEGTMIKYSLNALVLVVAISLPGTLIDKFVEYVVPSVP